MLGFYPLSDAGLSDLTGSGDGSYTPFPSSFDRRSLTVTIPSYLYVQYADDDDLQAFVAAYNALAQDYVDWFNDVNLPIYTGPLVFGALLDWVAAGLYGLLRPSLPSGLSRWLGPLNTWALNELELNGQRRVGPSNAYVATDDVFRRVMTWRLLKGDGKVFSVRWLKRRVMQFLFGADGIPLNIDQTYRVSVSFAGSQVNIRLINSVRTPGPTAMLNAFALNEVRPDQFSTTVVLLDPPLAMAVILKSAIDSGVLELPFQFTYVVTIV